MYLSERLWLIRRIIFDRCMFSLQFFLFFSLMIPVIANIHLVHLATISKKVLYVYIYVLWYYFNRDVLWYIRSQQDSESPAKFVALSVVGRSQHSSSSLVIQIKHTPFGINMFSHDGHLKQSPASPLIPRHNFLNIPGIGLCYAMKYFTHKIRY